MHKSILAATLLALLAGCQDAPDTNSAPAGQENAQSDAETRSEARSETQSDQSASEAETARLNSWFDEKFEEQLQQSPLRLTMLGRKDRHDEIDDVSRQAEREQFAWLESSAEELQANFDYDLLDDDAKISYDLWMFQYELARDGMPFLEHGYSFDQMRGAHSFLPQVLLAYHGVDNQDDMEAYNSRIRGIGGAIEELLSQAQAAAEDDRRPPRFAYDHVIRQSKALIDGAPFSDSDNEAPIYADAKRKVDELREQEEVTAEQADQLLSETRTALTEDFAPAYQSLIEWLESDRENTEVNTVGVSRHADGEDYYNYMLRVSTTTELTADEIHQIGLDEVDRITGEMNAIREQVGFDGDLQEFFEFIRTDERFFFPDTDEGREAYLQQSRDFLDNIADKLPEFFGRLPKADLVVRRVEPYREQDGAPQHYYPGSPDGSRSGVYYAHLSDMNAMPKNEMEAIAYHEGNPGHHMQISIAQELEDVPQFRTQARFTVYSEGWALYSEPLAKEMGGYEDPYSDFGRLVTEIWRAVRLVVDTGMHAKGWTEEEAVEYFSSHTPVPEAAVRSEVQRYLVMPGQATSYKIGMMKIQELRAWAEQELGDDFDIRGFHDTVLGGGALPLPLLERQVQNWVREQQS